MSTALLPPKLAGSPAVQRITSDLARLRGRNRDLRAEAAMSSSPIETTIAVQAGVAAAAAATVYMPERAPVAMGVGGLVLLAYGATSQSPWAVQAAQGVLSPLTFAKVVDVLSATRGEPAASTAKTASKAA